MSPTSSEVSTAVSLIETVMIILPIWLAGIRYFVEDFEGEEHTNRYFFQMVVLIYAVLAAVLISGGVVVTNLGNENLSSGIYGLWMLFFATGALTFRLIERQIESDVPSLFLWFGMIVGVFFMIASFGLLVLANL